MLTSGIVVLSESSVFASIVESATLISGSAMFVYLGLFILSNVLYINYT